RPRTPREGPHPPQAVDLGPDILGGVPRLASLTALSVRSHLESEAVLIDTRPEQNFNNGHVPGSYAVPHGNSMATWIGWVVPWGQPLVLLSADASHHDDMMRQLIRIGFDRVHGFLSGGIEAWQIAGLPIEASNRLALDSLKQSQDASTAPLVIDVRQRNEYAEGHIPGALNIELGELQEHLDGLPRELPVVMVCAAGMRATTAGSILQRDGRKNVQVIDEAGTPAWIERGYPSETGED
ncbi:MAG: rhodanese-like domain-containing protein, partial [Chloroflexi bacterium]|nr:rhodanese-like domain-containing protein [Chloroflexota bacterium]